MRADIIQLLTTLWYRYAIIQMAHSSMDVPFVENILFMKFLLKPRLPFLCKAVLISMSEGHCGSSVEYSPVKLENL